MWVVKWDFPGEPVKSWSLDDAENKSQFSHRSCYEKLVKEIDLDVYKYSLNGLEVFK